MALNLHRKLASIRGANVSSVSKLSPNADPLRKVFDPFLGQHTATILDTFQSMNLNCIRLMVSWEEIEPNRLQFNTSYLSGIKKFVRNCNNRSIDVILDFHQDLYSRKLGGDGFPDWVLPPKLQSLNQQYKETELWAGRLVFSPQQRIAWEHFWDDDSEVVEHYLNMMLTVLEYLKGVDLMAIDIINEPSFPELFLLSSVVRSKRKLRSCLTSFYSRIIPAISPKLGSNTLFFVEPYAADSSQFLQHIGMDPLNIPSPLLSRCVYAAHAYETVPLKPFPHWFRLGAPGRSFEGIIKNHLRTAHNLGIPLFIGEFGDLTMNSCSEWSLKSLGRQIYLMSRLGIGSCIYEFNPTKFTWNCEYMSIIDDKLIPTKVFDDIIKPLQVDNPLESCLVFIQTRKRLESQRQSRQLSSLFLPLLKHHSAVKSASFLQTVSFASNSRLIHVFNDPLVDSATLEPGISAIKGPELDTVFLSPCFSSGVFHCNSYGVFAVFNLESGINLDYILFKLQEMLINQLAVSFISVLTNLDHTIGGLIVGSDTERSSKSLYTSIRTLLLSNQSLLSLGVSAPGLSRLEEPFVPAIIKRPIDVQYSKFIVLISLIIGILAFFFLKNPAK
ncbi:hypothetical protein P9112_008748 [Eukaryota sp. TZLM1-RC]